VSTGEQDLSPQEASLRAAGCQVIRAEKRTGTSREGRTEPAILRQFLRAGDTLVITRIDRPARSEWQTSPASRELVAGDARIRSPAGPRGARRRLSWSRAR
jgi:DNA invertase Pin-like site-specific DNA recombinase